MEKRLLLISPWFGAWPEWINFFIESCKWNPKTDWLIITDQDPPENQAKNVTFKAKSFPDFKKECGEILDVDLKNLTAYKICDLRPAFGFIFSDELNGYGYFGYCDLDVIFGDLDGIYTNEFLNKYKAISSHGKVISGHLGVFRNSREITNIFQKIPNWKGLMSSEGHVGLDEGAFTRIFKPRPIIKRLWAPKSVFIERNTTPGGPLIWPDGQLGPSNWIWKNGKLSHERTTESQLYLHMMFWNSNRWLPEQMQPAPWAALESIVKCDWRNAGEKGFSISPRGIRPIH